MPEKSEVVLNIEGNRVTVSAETSSLSILRMFVDRKLREFSFKQDDIDAIELAVDEACTNIIEYAYPDAPGPEKTITLEIGLTRDDVHVFIMDYGVPVPEKVVKKFSSVKGKPKGEQVGGWGIYLIANSVNEVRYSRKKNANILRLKRKRLKLSAVAGRRPFFVGSLSLRAQFNAYIFFIFLVSAVCIAFLIIPQERRIIESRSINNGIWLARNFAGRVTAPYLAHDQLTLAVTARLMEENPQVAYAVITDSKDIVQIDPKGQLSGLLFSHGYFGNPILAQENVRCREARVLDMNVYDLQSDLTIRHLNKAVTLGSIHLGLNRNIINQVINDAIRNIGIIAIMILLVILVLTSIMTEFVIRPIRKLMAGVRQIGNGYFDYRLDLKSTQELKELSDAFNIMARDLKQGRETQLEKIKIEQELDMASHVQKLLLPKEIPSIPGCDFGMFYRSAKQLGGDYLDFIPISDELMGIVIADVAGKGVPAALMMSNVRSTLRAAAKSERSPKKVLTFLNEQITKDTTPDVFITMLYCIFNLQNREIKYASAGHCPLLCLPAGRNKIIEYKTLGFPLGIEQGPKFEERLEEGDQLLKTGDIIVLYSDGVNEAFNNRGEEFGEKRLFEAILKNQDLTAQQLATLIENEVSSFIGQKKRSDDISIITCKIK